MLKLIKTVEFKILKRSDLALYSFFASLVLTRSQFQELLIFMMYIL